MESFPEQRFIHNYHQSEVIFSEDSPGNEMYIIYSGSVKLFKGRKLLATLEAGDFFGEMALVDDSPRSATAVADEEDTRLVVLNKNTFAYLLRQQPDFALVVMGRLCDRLREANKAFADDQRTKYGNNDTNRKE